MKLHSKGNHVVLIIKSYFDFNISNEASAYPWCLCIGDKAATLQASGIIQVRPTTDSVAAHFWQLMRLNWLMCLLIEVLDNV